MYFHLVWIKEKNWNKYDLNLILKWWDEDFIRSFLSNRWVVIVSINEYKEDPNTFWDIIINLTYNWTEIQLISQWQDLSESILFFVSLWLRPSAINSLNNPVSENQMKDMINSTVLAAEEEDKKFKQREEIEEKKERKKYEESSIKDWLKIINSNIDHIEQVLKAGSGVLSSHEIKELENYLAEMKKIRLWTNFNKMSSLILDSHVLLENAEKEIFNANDQYKFLIDKNSSITNIDVLREYFNYNKISEKNTLGFGWLSAKDSIIGLAWSKSLFLKLLNRDIAHNLNWYSFDDFFNDAMNALEFIINLIIVIITLIRLGGLLIWTNKFSLYLLPAMGWLWLLVYLFNGLKLKWFVSKVVCFAVIVGIYWYGLRLLLGTFAL